MSQRKPQTQSILADMQPSKAIIKLAIPATLRCWPRPFTIW